MEHNMRFGFIGNTEKKWSNTFEVSLEARAEIITKNSMNLLVDLETPN